MVHHATGRLPALSICVVPGYKVSGKVDGARPLRVSELCPNMTRELIVKADFLIA